MLNKYVLLLALLLEAYFLIGCRNMTSLSTSLQGPSTAPAALPPVSLPLTDDSRALCIVPNFPKAITIGKEFDVPGLIINYAAEQQWFDEGSIAVDFEFYLRRVGAAQWMCLDGKPEADPFGLRSCCLSRNWVVCLDQYMGNVSTSHLKIENVAPGEYDIAIVRRFTSCGVIKSFRLIKVNAGE